MPKTDVSGRWRHMKLTIVETGLVPVEIRADWPDYPAQFRALLGPLAPEMRFETVSLPRGEALPDPAAVEAVLLTGSPSGVYDPELWMSRLFDFIRWSAETKTPMVGVCFGHQAMAHAMGGFAEKSHKGWGVGRHVYDIVSRPNWLTGDLDTVACACSHQDQVITAPPGAETILSSDFTPYAGLAYQTAPFISFQPHPEFTADYAAALYSLRRDRIGEARTDDALASLGQPLDRQLMGRWIVDFLANPQTR